MGAKALGVGRQRAGERYMQAGPVAEKEYILVPMLQLGGGAGVPTDWDAAAGPGISLARVVD